MATPEYLLAGDIGGTKILLALYDASSEGEPHRLREASFPSKQYKSLEDVISEFLAADPMTSAPGFKIAAAAFGLAGPVRDGRCDLMKLGWVVEREALIARFGFGRCELLNDLLSLAWGVTVLPEASMQTLNAGAPGAKGNAALIAPGTGLGEAVMFYDEHLGQSRSVAGPWLPSPSEGGLADFAPADSQQIALLQYIMQTHGVHSVERLVSGPGLGNIYGFLKSTNAEPESEAVTAEIAAAPDPNGVIGKHALDGTSPRCAAALDLFVRILAAEAGNLALRAVAWGGIYIGGGIPPKILPMLTPERFMPAFMARERYGKLMDRIAVKIILEPKTGLMGAAHYAHLMLRGER